MNVRSWRLFLSALVLVSVSVAGAAQDRKKDKAAPAARPSLAEDRGRFRLLADGQQVGTEEFRIAPAGSEWIATGKTEIKMPGTATQSVTSRLRLNADGGPLEYECTAQTSRKDSVSVSFSGGTARMVLQTDNFPGFTQEFNFENSRVLLLDNNLYHHYAILARLYDWQAKGPQTFPILIPQSQIPGSVTVETGGPQVVESVQYDHLRVRSADLTVDLYVDSARRLMRLSVPGSTVEVLREK